MNYPFPTITTINDVLDAIAGKDEFIVVEKPGYKVINYIYKTDTTFPDVVDRTSAILRECRGIIFDASTGKVLRRPLHKFFNLEERPEYSCDKINFNKPHIILAKLDGSQVAPFLVNKSIIWGTKMGETEMSFDIKVFVKGMRRTRHYEALAKACMSFNFTPIFEWCSHKNRVVIDYGAPNLTLIAVRHNESGAYSSQWVMDRLGCDYNVPVVEEVLSMNYVKDSKHLDILREHAKQLEGEEGYVLRFEDGHMLKIKSDWYIRLHRGKDDVSSERKVVNIILNEQIDDFLPALQEHDKERVLDYYAAFFEEFQICCEFIQAVIQHNTFKGISRKNYALFNTDTDLVQNVVFKLWEKLDVQMADIHLELARQARRYCTSNALFDRLKGMLFPKVKYE